ncbi:hypothetical protein V7147_21005 [Bacillus sp. JJ1521]|uniref:hypothetical protein n=1 Tax=Bacillus sp. JJ1521 TaxID=3122957 RepID=UPI002FFF8CE7
MPSLSKRKLERIAVDAINYEANRPSAQLVANIPVGDKGISFDGDIEVYKDHSESVSSLIGKVPVQVKGTQVTEFTNGTRTFSMGLGHFKNYYDSQGVVLLVVEIKKNGDTKIFYKQLLPNELREILKVYGERKGQKQRVVELRPLSETTLDTVCRKFIRESKKQPSILIERNPFKNDEFDSFELTSLTFNPNKNETSNIFEHDFTVYGIKEILSIPLNQGRIQSVTTDINDTVYSNGNEYNFSIKVTKEENRTIILIEDSLELVISEKQTKFNFKLIKLNSLASQLKILPFVLDFLISSSMKFKQISLKLENINLNNKEDTIKTFQELLSTFQKLKIIFEGLNVSDDITIDNRPGDLDLIIDQITSFVRMYLDKDYSKLKIKNPEQACFTLFRIGSLHLVFFYNPKSDKRLINAFSEELLKNDTRLSVGGDTFPHSPYTMLTDLALAHGVNVNLDIINRSFNSFDPFFNDITANFTNNFCLMCINAFDLSDNTNLLHLVNHIYDFYKGHNLDESIYFINKSQINYRLQGFINEKYIEKLIKLKQSDSTNTELQYCTSVLLESRHEAQLYYKQLGTEKQKFYNKLPINYLYRKLIEER